MTDEQFKMQVIKDLTILKVEMHKLVGNGQPGRIQKIEDRVFWVTLAVVGSIVASGSAAAPVVLTMLK